MDSVAAILGGADYAFFRANPVKVVQEKKLAESNITETNRLMSQYAVALKRLKKAIQAQKPTRMAPLLRFRLAAETD